MKNKSWGYVLVIIGVAFLQASFSSFTNTDYPTKKALITGGFTLLISIYPLIKGINILRKKVVDESSNNAS